MAEVGVLNLTIHDNSKTAGTGLEKLASALSAVKTAASGFSMSTVSTQIKTVVDSVKDEVKVVEQLGKLFNALSQFGKLKSLTIDTKQFSNLKEALTGISIGMTGTQLENIRKAVNGEWKTENMDDVISSMNSIHAAAAGWQQAGTSTTINAVAKSIDKFAKATDSVQNAGLFQTIASTIQSDASRIKTSAEEIQRSTEKIQDSTESTAKNNFKGVVDNAGDGNWLRDIFSKGKSIGENIDHGIADGTESGKGEVANAAREIAATVSRTLEDELEISSPSRVTEKIGEYTAQGFINGIMSKVAEIESAAQAMANAAIAGTGVGNVIEGPFSRVEETTQAAKQSMETIRDLNKAVAEGMERVSESASKTDYSSLDISKYLSSPVEALKDKYSIAGNAIESLKDKINVSIPAFREYRDAVLGLESKKDIAGFSRKSGDELLAATKSVVTGNEEVKTQLDQVSESIEEAENQFNNIGKVTKEATNDTNEFAESLERVETAVDRINAEDPAIRFGREWNESKPSGGTASSQTREDIAWARNLIETASETDLLAMKIDALRSKLEEGAVAGKLSGDQLANGIARIRKLEEEMDKLKESIPAATSSAADGFEKVAEQAESAYSSVKPLVETFDNAKTNKGLGGVAESLDAVTSLNELKKEVEDAGNAAILSADRIELLRRKAEILREEVSSGTSITGKALNEKQLVNMGLQINAVVEQIDKLKAKQEEMAGSAGRAKAAIKEATKETQKYGNSLKSLEKGINKMFPGITRLAHQFKNLATRMLMRSVINQLRDGFKEGVENVYWYSKALNGDFAKAMDGAASSLLQMKNSIGAAVAPLIQALIPYLQIAVNWFIEAVNYVNQFFALLNGQSTWIRAIPKTTEAFEDQTKAAKKTGAAVKDLLADWDELNIIQSDSGGSGGSLTTSKAEEALTMFETMNSFDGKIKDAVEWIKENFDLIKTLAIEIGTLILGWKISRGFEDVLGTIGKLVAAGAAIVIGVSLAYTGAFEAGRNGGWTTETLLSTIGGTIASALGGAYIGYKFGGIKGLIAGVTFSVLISLITTIVAYDKGNAQAVASAAFASTGKGGIKVDDYISALQAELDKQTESANLILNTRIEVPNLKNSLRRAISEIVAFNTIILKGEGKLTEEDVAAFKAAWGTVLDTLDQISSKNYDTLLSGLIAALQTQNEELRKQAEATRTSLIMVRDNVSEARAEYIKGTEDLAEKIRSNTATTEEIEEYQQRVAYILRTSGEQVSYTEGVEEEIKKADRIDFGDEKTALDNATQFIDTITASATEAFDKVAEAKGAIEEARQGAIAEVEEYVRAGQFTEEQGHGYIAEINASAQVNLDFLTESENNIRKKVQDAYDIVFRQLFEAAGQLQGDKKDYFLRNVIRPIMGKALEQGFKLPADVATDETIRDIVNMKIGLELREAYDEVVEGTAVGFINSIIKNFTGNDLYDWAEYLISKSFGSNKNNKSKSIFEQAIRGLNNVLFPGYTEFVDDLLENPEKTAHGFIDKIMSALIPDVNKREEIYEFVDDNILYHEATPEQLAENERRAEESKQIWTGVLETTVGALNGVIDFMDNNVLYHEPGEEVESHKIDIIQMTDEDWENYEKSMQFFDWYNSQKGSGLTTMEPYTPYNPADNMQSTLITTTDGPFVILPDNGTPKEEFDPFDNGETKQLIMDLLLEGYGPYSLTEHAETPDYLEDLKQITTGMEFDEKTKKRIGDTIVYSFFTSGNVDWETMDFADITEAFGAYLMQMGWDELFPDIADYIFEGFIEEESNNWWGTGSNKRFFYANQLMAGIPQEYMGPYMGGTGESDMSSEVEKGTKEANSALENLLTLILNQLRQNQNTPVQVNVAPSSGWGAHAARSNAMYNEVVGMY